MSDQLAFSGGVSLECEQQDFGVVGCSGSMSVQPVARPETVSTSPLPRRL